MHNPPLPGKVLKTLCLEPLNLSVTEAAKALDVSRKTLSAILNGRAGISPEMAVRLSVAFDTSAESWLSQQVQYDLWHAEQHGKNLGSKNLLRNDFPSSVDSHDPLHCPCASNQSDFSIRRRNQTRL
jgi:addiction module HigA family antidote